MLAIAIWLTQNYPYPQSSLFLSWQLVAIPCQVHHPVFYYGWLLSGTLLPWGQWHAPKYFGHQYHLMQYPSSLILSKLTFMVKNEVRKDNGLSLTTCFLTSEKHSFGVHTDKSTKICTHVEQIFLYNLDCYWTSMSRFIFFKVKILPKTVFPFSVHFIARVGRYRCQSEACIYFDWQPTLSHSSLSAPVA